MNPSDKFSSPFEKQLQQSALRLRDQQNYNLPSRKNPRHRFSWGWTTTAAAALVGWFMGISFPINNSLPETSVALATSTDTIIQYKEKIVRDTIIHQVPIPVVHQPQTASTASQRHPTTKGCNMECDGIDYSLLIGNN